jgi:hypothetical protein
VIGTVRQDAILASSAVGARPLLEDGGLFTLQGLAAHRAVVFLNTTGDVLNDSQQAVFEAYLRGGGGWVGVHSAADTETAWPFYGELLGEPGSGVTRRSSLPRANSSLLLLAADQAGTLGIMPVLGGGTVHLILDVSGYFE